MNKDIIYRLLQSNVREDVILGINYLRDYEFEDIRRLWASFVINLDSFRIDVNCEGDRNIDNYKFPGGFFCHYNKHIHFYEKDYTRFSHVNYTDL